MQRTDPAESLELIRRMSREDRAAFSRFYDLFCPLAYTIALRILRSRPDAEDLLQEVFLQLWNKASTYDLKRGRPEAWVIMVTKSRAIDKLRSLRRRETGAPLLEEASKLRAGEQERRGEVDLEVKLTVQGALAGLSEIQRTALELAYFEGLTQSEIAVRLAVPIGTVKTRLRDGLKRLREILKTNSVNSHFDERSEEKSRF